MANSEGCINYMAIIVSVDVSAEYLLSPYPFTTHHDHFIYRVNIILYIPFWYIRICNNDNIHMSHFILKLFIGWLPTVQYILALVCLSSCYSLNWYWANIYFSCRKLVEAGVSHLHLDNGFLLTFLPPLRHNYEALFKKNKERNVSWGGYSDDGTKHGLYREVILCYILYLCKVKHSINNVSALYSNRMYTILLCINSICMYV